MVPVLNTGQFMLQKTLSLYYAMCLLACVGSENAKVSALGALLFSFFTVEMMIYWKITQ